MTALAKDGYAPHKEYSKISIPVGAGETIYKPAMIAIGVDGYAVPASDTAGLIVQGWAEEAVDNSAGSDGDLNVIVVKGKPLLMACSSADETWVDKDVYVVDDQTVGLYVTPTNKIKAGRVTEYVSATQVYVLLGDYKEPADGNWDSFTTATTPASGSCAVQLVFKDKNGVTVKEPMTGELYLSKVSTGLTEDLAGTSLAVLTNGVLTNLVAKGRSAFITTAAGLLGMTITNGSADSFWVVARHPSGKLVISDECVENA